MRDKNRNFHELGGKSDFFFLEHAIVFVVSLGSTCHKWAGVLHSPAHLLPHRRRAPGPTARSPTSPANSIRPARPPAAVPLPLAVAGGRIDWSKMLTGQGVSRDHGSCSHTRCRRPPQATRRFLSTAPRALLSPLAGPTPLTPSPTPPTIYGICSLYHSITAEPHVEHCATQPTDGRNALSQQRERIWFLKFCFRIQLPTVGNTIWKELFQIYVLTVLLTRNEGPVRCA